MKAVRLAGWITASTLAGLACSGEHDGEPAALAPASGALERGATLGGFLDAHWQLPVPLQGPLPEGWSEAEASLHPADCGACHPQQLADWRESLHAGAYSPGFAGQLIEGALASPAALRNCQTCHTPLEEQQPVRADGAASAHYDPTLREQGIVCASCHVRAHQRFGPPPRADRSAVSESIPHGGFEVRAEYQEARFCAPCHQFFDDAGVNGKPLENTFAEWQASPQAAEGRTCQSCHMPDRRHQWRGIHDPEMVRQGVEVTFERKRGGDPVRAKLAVHNRDVGHAFPTYVTPRVFLAVWQADERGAVLPGTRREAVIAREIDFSATPWRENFDTRVQPGRAVTLTYEQPRAEGAETLVGRVTVDPDHHYRGVFRGLVESYRDPEARRLMAEALARSEQSSFVLEEIVLALDRTH